MQRAAASQDSTYKFDNTISYKDELTASAEGIYQYTAINKKVTGYDPDTAIVSFEIEINPDAIILNDMGKIVKRIFDLLLAIILIIPGFLVLLCGMLFVKIVSPESSPIFKQTRVGYKNKLFTMYKLRSMTNERDAEGNLLPDEQEEMMVAMKIDKDAPMGLVNEVKMQLRKAGALKVHYAATKKQFIPSER
jgi:hypothetical protein